jgi:RNA polymerase sigma factor (sigma-70 family)
MRATKIAKEKSMNTHKRAIEDVEFENPMIFFIFILPLEASTLNLPGFSEILDGCLKNDRRSQHQLYKLVYEILFRVCRRYTVNQDDAVDMVNTSFIKIIKSLTEYRREDSFSAWVSRIGVNTAIDEIRKSKRYHQHVQTREDDSQLQHDAEVKSLNQGFSSLEAKDILKMVHQLPDLTREIFNLYALDGYSHREISDLLGIAETASRWHLHRARQILKDKILIEQKAKVA